MLDAGRFLRSTSNIKEFMTVQVNKLFYGQYIHCAVLQKVFCCPYW